MGFEHIGRLPRWRLPPARGLWPEINLPCQVPAVPGRPSVPGAFASSYRPDSAVWYNNCSRGEEMRLDGQAGQRNRSAAAAGKQSQSSTPAEEYNTQG